MEQLHNKMEMKIKHPSPSSDVFYRKLTEFHQTTGSSLISNVACSVLDLYSFYKEVTSRGGYLQVSREGRWREVASAMNYSNSSPQPALLLQNVYSNLLYQFERTYDVFGSSLSEPLSDSIPTNNTLPDCLSGFGESPTATRSDESNEEDLGSGNKVGRSICGVIEKEVEFGYLISVMIGTEKLNGVLYYQLNNLTSTEQFAATPTLTGNDAIFDENPDLFEPVIARSSMQSERSMTMSSRKDMAKKERKKVDEKAPLGTRSAYQLFLVKECDRLKKKHGKKAKIMPMAIDAWRRLPEKDREPYVEESKKDKERFEREMVSYNERKGTNKDYCVSIEADQLKGQDEDNVSAAGFAELMQNSAKFDTTMQMQIEMDDEFLSLH